MAPRASRCPGRAFYSLERGAASRASGARGGRRAYLGGLPPPEPPALFSRTIFDLFFGGVFGVFWHPDCQVWVQISPYSIFYYLTYNLLPNYNYFRQLLRVSFGPFRPCSTVRISVKTFSKGLGTSSESFIRRNGSGDGSLEVPPHDYF